MSDLVRDAMAAGTATLTRLVDVPVEPFGFGVDTLGIDDWTDTLDEVDPFTVRGISQALARRLQTPRGTLQDDLAYGTDVRGALNRPMTFAQVRALEGSVRGEVLEDDRVVEATVSVTFESQKFLRVHVHVTPADARTGGPFRLTLAVTSGSVLLEAIHADA